MSQHEQNRTDVEPEELQPCLDYGKKAYEAIMKADLPEAAAAIEGHCTFVPGSSVWVVEKVWKDLKHRQKWGMFIWIRFIPNTYTLPNVFGPLPESDMLTQYEALLTGYWS